MQLTPLLVLWLGVIGLVIHVALGALQSGTFNNILAGYSLPPINVKVFPWLGLVLGLAGGVVMGLQAGDTPLVALAKAITAMVTGGASALHLETIRGALPANTPGAAGALQVVAVQKLSVPPPAPPVVKRTRRRTWRFLPALGLAAFLSACISSAPIVPVTPTNTNQVSSCQSIASTHNDLVVGDFVVGGLTSALAGVGASVADPTSKNALAVSASISGAVAIVGTALTGFTASEFTNSACSTVVGPLPVGAAAAGR